MALEVPATQAVQVVVPAALHSPSKQQVPAPALLYLPAEQGLHANDDVAPLAELERPAAQRRHESRDSYFPMPQITAADGRAKRSTPKKEKNGISNVAS